MTLIDLLEEMYPELSDPQRSALATLYLNPDGVRAVPADSSSMAELAAQNHCHPTFLHMGIAKFPAFQISHDSLNDIAVTIDAQVTEEA